MGQLDGRNFVNDTAEPSHTWFTDNIHTEDQPLVRAAINEAIRTKGNFELEHRVRRVDGSFGWSFSRAIPILNAKGEIVEWFGAVSDITKRKQLEQQKEEFIGIASHEIKTPVTTIKTFTELLQKKLSDNVKKENVVILQHIVTQSDRLTTLVDDLLSFSQMQTGKFLLNEKEFDLGTLIKRTVDAMKETAPKHKITL